MSEIIASFDVRVVTVLSGMTVPMLNYLDRASILKPQFGGARGRGRKRRYSYADVVLLRSLRRLLDAGVSVLNLKRALKKFRESYSFDTAADGTRSYFVTDGKEVFLKMGEEVIEQLSTGQLAFAFVLEISQVRKEVDDRIAAMGDEHERLRSA